MSITSRIKHPVKSFVEKSLGVTISRNAPPPPPNKHADAELQGLRNWTDNDVIFDVGANDGRTILRMGNLLGAPRIYAFEPVSSTYQTLVEQTKHMPNVRHFQLALGEKPGKEEIYINEMAAMNSFSPKWGESSGTETVEISTVDRVMGEQGLDFVHYLKIDTEGFEMEVLKGAKEALAASRIGMILVEAGFEQMGRGYTSLEQVRSHLAPMGYVLYGIYNQCRTAAQPPRGWSEEQVSGYKPEALAYCDALFIRAEL